jgi:hypothetical protein
LTPNGGGIRINIRDQQIYPTHRQDSKTRVQDSDASYTTIEKKELDDNGPQNGLKGKVKKK